MKKSAITMLVLSLVFVIIAIFFFAFTSAFAIGSLTAFFDPKGDAGDKIGGIFLFIAMLPFCLGLFVSAASVLPFNLVMLLKMKIKAWYTIAILIFAIAAMASAIIYVVAFPLLTSINSSSSAISSSRSA